MDHRRFVTFLVFFVAFTFLYNGFIRPKFFPQPPRPLPAQDDGDGAADGDDSSEDVNPDSTADDTNIEAVTELTEHPEDSVLIGSLEPKSGYFLRAKLTTVGAGIESVHLTDPQFRELDKPDEQLKVIGNTETANRTFSTAVAAIDKQLRRFQVTLETVNWKIESSDESSVHFSFDAPDGKLRVEKTFRVAQVEVPPEQLESEYRTNSNGFTIQMDLKVTNLADTPVSVDYELQGPVGIVLENRAHTRKYRDIKLQFIGEDDDVTMTTKEVKALYEKHHEAGLENGKNLNDRQLREAIKQQDPWTGVFRYAGVDVQSFAALVAVLDKREEAERLKNKLLYRTYPVMIAENADNVYESDISFRMVSMPQDLEAKGGNDSVTHSYAFYVGPKRSTLLDPAPFEADRVLDIGTGFFSFFGLTGVIARLMHFLLSSFHSLGIPYGICIILLTVLVRGCMFPISRKQALSAAKMKELQPKINELKQKYGDDKQKIAAAQMELWRKHKINPLSGCMPVLFQMPIFIGLYQCLNTATDLRMASFLWIDNLGAPDAMLNFPFDTPGWLGPHISVLPLVTVVLFLVQQKMFMPPPADEQAEMTQKMMNMMTFMFGALFWHQPAGLCVYFICSSLWGITERKLLSNTKIDLEETPSVTVKEPDSKGGGAKGKPAADPSVPEKKGFFARLMEAAEEAQKQSEQMREKERKGNKNNKGGKGKNKKKGR